MTTVCRTSPSSSWTTTNTSACPTTRPGRRREKTVVKIHQVKIRSPGSEVAVRLGSPVKLRSEAAEVSGNNNKRAATGQSVAGGEGEAGGRHPWVKGRSNYYTSHLHHLLQGSIFQLKSTITTIKEASFPQVEKVPYLSKPPDLSRDIQDEQSDLQLLQWAPALCSVAPAGIIGPSR